MQWQDEGLVLGCRKHGETSVILETLTRDHGRVLGLVRGGRARRMQPTLQPGNRVHLTWRARLEDHLGQFVVEPLIMRAAALMQSASGVLGIQLIAAHLRLLPERETATGVFEAVEAMAAHLNEPLEAAELMVRFEIALLNELGFGLDLTRCAMTGVREGLRYVSPKTGRAVTSEAGQPWADKLLSLPSFLRPGANERADSVAAAQAFALTGHFLMRDVYQARGIDMPQAREAFVRAISGAPFIPPQPAEAAAQLALP
jgi:DNA repair protein RecO (recombination protein O)